MRHEAARTPVIDGFPFSEGGGRLQGVWPVAKFARLQDLLASNCGDLDYEVLGTRDELGRQCLGVKVSGALQLACQRCLGALPYPLAIDALLQLARSEEEIESRPVEAEGADCVVAGKEMAVGTLLEDEILLAIPLAPRHERCAGATAAAEEAKPSPFEGLRMLLDRGGSAKN